MFYRHNRFGGLKWLLGFAVLILIAAPVSYRYASSGGRLCVSCHEMRQTQHFWANSTHRGVGCDACHGGGISDGVRFHVRNAERAWAHFRGRVPEKVGIQSDDVPALVARCAVCHRQEFADWQTGPHSSTYSELFLDVKHNEKRLLIDDCLRCHGMHFNGGVGALVRPLKTEGPWKLVRPEIGSQPAIPCMACHSIHREGQPLGRPAQRGMREAAREPLSRPSLALFDRRQQESVPVSLLKLPQMRDGERVVKMSPDRRQALCYECHAPLPTAQVRSSDDRTPVGVHEGISCLGCHQQHGQGTRASCGTCHPRLSNCGIDVETMDTTFKSTKSSHNVHFVKCADCHKNGVPKKRVDPGITKAD